MPSILTVGHSTRTQEAFVELLRAHAVSGVADVRRYPASRRHPHFAGESLSEWLSGAGIQYRHFEALGGRRKPAADSPNAGWEQPAFRGYADYMATGEFQEALGDLLAFSAMRHVAVMCAEAPWWRCHRRLIADALMARGVDVRHIMTPGRAPLHALPSFASVTDSSVSYPGPGLDVFRWKAPS